jgi:3-oxoacyl-[acyl-carrier protein] reductase
VDIDRLFTEAKTAFGRIDIVIANSGIANGFFPIATMTNVQMEQLLDVNVKGTFYTLRAAANYVEANGRIIVIGSTLRNGMTAGVGMYSATKAAVEVLAKTLAQELGHKGITVNTIHPGK